MKTTFCRDINIYYIKKLITINNMKNKILLLIAVMLMSLASYSQSVLLNRTKKTVMREMTQYLQFKLSVEAKDYVEYQGSNVAVGYRFEDRLSTEMLVSMETGYRQYFLKERDDCDCWLETSDGGWVYKEIVDNRWVLIREITGEGVTTFVYYLK